MQNSISKWQFLGLKSSFIHRIWWFIIMRVNPFSSRVSLSSPLHYTFPGQYILLRVNTCLLAMYKSLAHPKLIHFHLKSNSYYKFCHLRFNLDDGDQNLKLNTCLRNLSNSFNKLKTFIMKTLLPSNCYFSEKFPSGWIFITNKFITSVYCFK